MVIVAIHQGNLDRFSRQRLGCLQTAKTGAKNNDLGESRILFFIVHLSIPLTDPVFIVKNITNKYYQIYPNISRPPLS